MENLVLNILEKCKQCLKRGFMHENITEINFDKENIIWKEDRVQTVEVI